MPLFGFCEAPDGNWESKSTIPREGKSVQPRSPYMYGPFHHSHMHHHARLYSGRKLPLYPRQQYGCRHHIISLPSILARTLGSTMLGHASSTRTLSCGRKLAVGVLKSPADAHHVAARSRDLAKSEVRSTGLSARSRPRT
jgi:hypothetical protein